MIRRPPRSTLFPYTSSSDLVAMLTTFYMSRLVLVAFFGPARSDDADHAQESPKAMVLPLLALAVPSALAGFFSLAQPYGTQLGATHLRSKVLRSAARLS